MSRFFELLKEASRSLPEAARDRGPMEAAGQGDAAPAPEEGRNEREQPAAAAFADETQAAWALKDMADSFPVAPAGPLGSTAQTNVDLRPPLLNRAVDPAVVEHYRRLRTKLLAQHATKPFRSVLVASPNAQEGKTLTVLNLGLSFAMIPNFKVLVVDGDLRKGTMGKWLGVNDQPGLSNLLDGSAQLEETVLKSEALPLHFMVRGQSKQAPGELLQSPQLRTSLRRVTEHYDLVLVDSPPVNLVADAHLLAGGCDGALLIARAFVTTCKAFQKMAQDLATPRILGAVLNGGTRAQLYRRYNSYYKSN